MESNQAVDIINQGRALIQQWIYQDGPNSEGAIKDRDITRCLRTLREAARYAPHHEATIVAKIVELAEARLNSAR